MPGLAGIVLHSPLASGQRPRGSPHAVLCMVWGHIPLQGVAATLAQRVFRFCGGFAGMRVMHPTWTMWPSWLDVFSNINLVPKIEAPVLIMHVRLPPCFLLGMSSEQHVLTYPCLRRLAGVKAHPAVG